MKCIYEEYKLKISLKVVVSKDLVSLLYYDDMPLHDENIFQFSWKDFESYNLRKEYLPLDFILKSFGFSHYVKARQEILNYYDAINY